MGHAKMHKTARPPSQLLEQRPAQEKPQQDNHLFDRLDTMVDQLMGAGDSGAVSPSSLVSPVRRSLRHMHLAQSTPSMLQAPTLQSGNLPPPPHNPSPGSIRALQLVDYSESGRPNGDLGPNQPAANYIYRSTILPRAAPIAAPSAGRMANVKTIYVPPRRQSRQQSASESKDASSDDDEDAEESRPPRSRRRSARQAAKRHSLRVSLAPRVAAAPAADLTAVQEEDEVAESPLRRTLRSPGTTASKHTLVHSTDAVRAATLIAAVTDSPSGSVGSSPRRPRRKLAGPVGDSSASFGSKSGSPATVSGSQQPPSRPQPAGDSALAVASTLQASDLPPPPVALGPSGAPTVDSRSRPATGPMPLKSALKVRGPIGSLSVSGAGDGNNGRSAGSLHSQPAQQPVQQPAQNLAQQPAPTPNVAQQPVQQPTQQQQPQRNHDKRAPKVARKGHGLKKPLNRLLNRAVNLFGAGTPNEREQLQDSQGFEWQTAATNATATAAPTLQRDRTRLLREPIESSDDSDMSVSGPLVPRDAEKTLPLQLRATIAPVAPRAPAAPNRSPSDERSADDTSVVNRPSVFDLFGIQYATSLAKDRVQTIANSKTTTLMARDSSDIAERIAAERAMTLVPQRRAGVPSASSDSPAGDFERATTLVASTLPAAPPTLAGSTVQSVDVRAQTLVPASRSAAPTLMPLAAPAAQQQLVDERAKTLVPSSRSAAPTLLPPATLGLKQHPVDERAKTLVPSSRSAAPTLLPPATLGLKQHPVDERAKTLVPSSRSAAPTLVPPAATHVNQHQVDERAKTLVPSSRAAIPTLMPLAAPVMQERMVDERAKTLVPSSRAAVPTLMPLAAAQERLVDERAKTLVPSGRDAVQALIPPATQTSTQHSVDERAKTLIPTSRAAVPTLMPMAAAPERLVDERAKTLIANSRNAIPTLMPLAAPANLQQPFNERAKTLVPSQPVSQKQRVEDRATLLPNGPPTSTSEIPAIPDAVPRRLRKELGAEGPQPNARLDARETLVAPAALDLSRTAGASHDQKSPESPTKRRRFAGKGESSNSSSMLQETPVELTNALMARRAGGATLDYAKHATIYESTVTSDTLQRLIPKSPTSTGVRASRVSMRNSIRASIRVSSAMMIGLSPAYLRELSHLGGWGAERSLAPAEADAPPLPVSLPSSDSCGTCGARLANQSETLVLTDAGTRHCLSHFTCHGCHAPLTRQQRAVGGSGERCLKHQVPAAIIPGSARVALPTDRVPLEYYALVPDERFCASCWASSMLPQLHCGFCHASLLQLPAGPNSAPRAFVHALGRYFHNEHFRCKLCGTGLVGSRDRPFKFYEDMSRPNQAGQGQPVCEGCFDAILGLNCGACQQRISELDGDDDYITVEGLETRDGDTGVAQSFHERCFCCTTCHVGLADSEFFQWKANLYCATHYRQQLQRKCDVCHGAISAAHLRLVERELGSDAPLPAPAQPLRNIVLHSRAHKRLTIASIVTEEDEDDDGADEAPASPGKRRARGGVDSSYFGPPESQAVALAPSMRKMHVHFGCASCRQCRRQLFSQADQRMQEYRLFRDELWCQDCYLIYWG